MTPTEILEVPCASVFPNPDQPRQAFDPLALNELAASIRKHGVLNPIRVERVESATGTAYILIAGERRLRASRIAGLPTIPAIVELPSGDAPGVPPARFLRAIVENVHRADLSPLEEARSYKRLVDEYGWTPNRIAEELGTYQARVAKRLKLLEYEPEIQALVERGEFPSDGELARDMLRIPNAGARLALARKLSARGASIRTARAAAVKLGGELAGKSTRLPAGEAPAVSLAGGRPEPAKWDSLRQLGYLPPWPAVLLAARATCKACALAEHASESTCCECPSVALLRSLVEAAANGRGLPLSAHKYAAKSPARPAHVPAR